VQVVAQDSKRRRGAVAAGANSVTAVYSKAASYQVQLALRVRMMSVFCVIRNELPSKEDLSMFISLSVLQGGSGETTVTSQLNSYQ